MALYPTKNRRYVALSGWEGSGKSEGVKHAHQMLGFFMVPEIARICFPINQSILEKPLDELSEQTFTGYVLGHHFCMANKIKHAIFDRCILDPLTYQALYSPNKQLNIDAIKGYINKLNDDTHQDTLLDSVVLLRHPKDADFIANTVFADKGRKYSSSIVQYKKDAQQFEDIFQTLFERIPGIANELLLIDAYPENEQILNDISFIAAGLK